MAKSKRKPLSFSTTMRNPERIPFFLECIEPYEGKLLTSSIIHEVVKSLIKAKQYRPNFISHDDNLKMIYESEDVFFTEEQVERIIKNSPQKHKEAGFETGWDSRFDTWYKMIKEFGFIKYAMNKPIAITKTGHMLIDASKKSPRDERMIHTVFCNALVRYQINNPLRRNANENAPLPLLLKTIRLFDEDPEEKNNGLATHELPLLICWKDNNAKAVYEFIKAKRKEVGFNCSDEYIYEKCLSILESNERTYLKIEKICHESVDEYIRKMRMSGMLSLRGNGRFLDVNRYQDNMVDYVIKKYMNYPKYTDEDSYVDYMGTIDSEIVDFEEQPEADTTDIKIATLRKFASERSREDIANELQCLCGRKESKDGLLRFISEPTRLEFLVSAALIQKFDNIEINPNYVVDDEGIPVYTAGGGMPDIVCHDADCESFFEVTMMCGRQDQVHNEIIPISRHLREAALRCEKDVFTVFLAPVIHDDTRESAEWENKKHNIEIITFSIPEFIDLLERIERPLQLKQA